MAPTFFERDGVRLAYRVQGEGPLVVMVMGTGSPGRVWHLHQVPALVAAGYRVATPDNRGVPASAECAAGITMDDLVGDLVALVGELGGGPVRAVGTSLGARVVAELALARPELVTQAVLMAAHGRPDPVQLRLSAGEKALHDSGIELPPAYHAAVTARLNLSARTLADPVAVGDWLDLFEMAGSRITDGVRAQLGVTDTDRLAAYRAIRVPTMVVGFADDRVLPPYLAREVAEAIPGARYEELADCGHYGYLERPDAVNELLLAWFAASPDSTSKAPLRSG